MTLLKDELFTENNIIDPNWVIRYLFNHLSYGRVSTSQVKKVVDKMCNHLRGVNIKFKKDNSVHGCYAVAGVFDTEVKNGIQIEIFNDSIDKKFMLPEVYYRQFIFDLADTLCHESIHRYQHQVRSEEDLFDGYSSEQHELYYADPDELFAYSVNIAHSLYRLHQENTTMLLSSYTSILEHDSYFKDYCSIFPNQKILKKLLKMIYLNILAIQQGDVCHRPKLIHA
jgi:hypothetical protein